MAAIIKEAGEDRADKCAKKSDIDSLYAAFATYFGASVGYELIDDRRAFQRTKRKADGVVERLVQMTRLTKAKVIEDLFQRMQTTLHTRNNMAKPQPRYGKAASGVVGVIAIFTGLFFLSAGLTGRVIANAGYSSVNWIGGALFLIGLIATFAYFRMK
jgi:hypothetical protein